MASTDRQIWYAHTIGCYSAIKRNEVLTHGTIKIGLINTNLWGRKAQKSTQHRIPFTWNVQYNTTQEIR